MQFACPSTDDFFRSRIDHMIDQRHPLAVLASRMPWQEIEARAAQVFARKGRAGVAMPDLDLFGEQVQRAPVSSNAGRPRVPLLVGGWGPRALALAGERADEIKVGGSANPDVVRPVRERIAVGALRAGRDPREIGVALGAVTVVDEDGERARGLVRRELALYLPVVAPLDPTVTIDPELAARIDALVAAGDQSAAGQLIPDTLLDRFAFAGTPAQVIAQCEAAFAAGATRIEFGTPHGLTPEGGIRLLGERVLPALRD